MRKIYLIILLTLSFFSFSYSQNCDYEISSATHHNWVDVVAGIKSPCSGLGCDSLIKRSSQKLEIGTMSEPGGGEISFRSFIKFDQSLNISNSCQPYQAYLQLYFTGNSADSHNVDSGANDFVIRRIIEPWGDDTLRWKKPPLVTPYRMPNSTSKDEVVVSGSKIGDEDFKIDISKLIYFWWSQPDSNFGFEIKLVNESARRGLNFASANHPNPSIRPKITYKYTSCSKNKAYAGKDVSICQGENVELEGKWGEFFKWDNDATLSNLYISNPTASPSKNTTYYLQTTLGNCSSRDSMMVTVNPYPTLSVSAASNSICVGDTVQLSANTNATNIKWTPTKRINSTSIANPFAYPTTTTTYTVDVDNGNKCNVTKDLKITVKPLPTTDAGKNTAICPGESIVLLATGANTYTWDASPGLTNINTASPTATPTASTTYRVVGSLNGCSTSDTVRVTVNPDIPLDAGTNQKICFGDTVYLEASSGFKVYEWNSTDPTNPVNFSNSKIKDPFILDLSNTNTIELVAFDKNNCKKVDQLQIVVNQNPQLDAGIDTFVCFGEEVKLRPIKVIGQGKITYRWTETLGMEPGDEVIDTPIVKGVEAGIISYTLVITDENGCQTEDFVKVNVLERPVFEIIADKETVCEGQPVTIRGSGAGEYEWFPKEHIIGSSTAQRITVIPPVEPVLFKFYGNTFVNCGEDTSDGVLINVIELPEPKIGVFENNELKYVDLEKACKGDSVVLKVEGAESYSWNELQDSSSEITVRVIGESLKYSVVGFSKGCRGKSDSVTLEIDPADSCSSKIFAPSAFIPSGAINDENANFLVKHYKIKQYHVQVFNRWGTKIFESSDLDTPWDGTHDGELVEPGAYFYVITAFGEDEEVRNLNGYVTVLY